MTGHGGFVYATPIPTRYNDESDDDFAARVVRYMKDKIKTVENMHEAIGIIATSFYVTNVDVYYENDVVPYFDMSFDYIDIKIHIKLVRNILHPDGRGYISVFRAK